LFSSSPHVARNHIRIEIARRNCHYYRLLRNLFNVAEHIRLG
jgi:hypothetical protein